ncbi:hypothetical protein [Limosilactobacillus sp.]|uniref:hypothetical protein n=1 Tax=Limosilactobacillus sp. TaxID=2773925 RepID=UPI00345EBC56
MIATLIASFIGFLIENTVRKHSKDPDSNWFLTKLFRPMATRITVEDQQERRELRRKLSNSWMRIEIRPHPSTMISGD